VVKFSYKVGSLETGGLRKARTAENLPSLLFLLFRFRTDDLFSLNKSEKVYFPRRGRPVGDYAHLFLPGMSSPQEKVPFPPSPVFKPPPYAISPPFGTAIPSSFSGHWRVSDSPSTEKLFVRKVFPLGLCEPVPKKAFKRKLTSFFVV